MSKVFVSHDEQEEFHRSITTKTYYLIFIIDMEVNGEVAKRIYLGDKRPWIDFATYLLYNKNRPASFLDSGVPSGKYCLTEHQNLRKTPETEQHRT